MNRSLQLACNQRRPLVRHRNAPRSARRAPPALTLLEWLYDYFIRPSARRLLSCPDMRERLSNQQLLRPRIAAPAELVRWMGAVQAQDYAGGLWGVGLRTAKALEADVEQAIADRSIVRTWPMRGTLHLVPARDVRWMLRHLASRVLTRSAGRHRALGLDDAVFARSRTLLSRALAGGKRLTRPDAFAVLERGGVSPAGQRGIHILSHLAQEGLLCFGPREGRQPTFVLLEEWLPAAPEPSRAEGLAALTRRYFRSHGPATARDFAWWTGLPQRDAREAMDAAGPGLDRRSQKPRSAEPAAVLLPPWDEYLVGYRDRVAALGHLDPDHPRLAGAIGIPLILIDGRARGAWRRALTPSQVRLRLEYWGRVTAAERHAVEHAALRYSRFLGRELLTETSP
jgi:hypothetical protein